MAKKRAKSNVVSGQVAKVKKMKSPGPTDRPAEARRNMKSDELNNYVTSFLDNHGQNVLQDFDFLEPSEKVGYLLALTQADFPDNEIPSHVPTRNVVEHVRGYVNERSD